jgi:two-component system, sensor histidine kinase and response regulator
LVFAKALVLFATDCHKHADDLEGFLSSSPTDYNSAKRVVHTLKGVAGNLGVEKVFNLANAIDSKLKDENQTIEKTELDELRSSLSLIVPAITSLNLITGGETPQIKAFNSEVVHNLLNELLLVLDELDPDTAEPKLIQLSEYIEKSELDPIHKELDAFDFDMAKTKTSQLALKLGLNLE